MYPVFLEETVADGRYITQNVAGDFGSDSMLLRGGHENLRRQR